MSQIKDTLTNVTLSGVEVWHLVLDIFLRSLHIERKINGSVEKIFGRYDDLSTPLRMTSFRKIKNKQPSLRAIAKQSQTKKDCFVVPPRNDVNLLIIIFLFCFIPLHSFASVGDSLKYYPLNDPRNPNCPCHQYQKLADEEYKRMLGEQQVQVSNNVVQTSNTNVTASNGTSSSKNTHGSHKLKRKKISARQKKFKRMIQITNWKIFRRWKDPSACFKWK